MRGSSKVFSSNGRVRYWPFLIAASAEHDYAFVLCPDFISNAGDLGIFRMREFAVNSSEPVGLRRVTVYRKTDPTEITFVYEVRQTAAEGVPTIDRSGRPLFHAFGFVHEGSQWGGAHDEQELVHAQAASASSLLLDFISAGDEVRRTAPALHTSAHSAGRGRVAPIWLLAVGIASAVAILVGAWVLLSDLFKRPVGQNASTSSHRNEGQ